MKKHFIISLFAVCYCLTAQSQTQSLTAINSVDRPLSQQMAATVMTIWKDSFSLEDNRPARWSYDQGVILKGFENIWVNTGVPRYFEYIQRSMDFFVQEGGTGAHAAGVGRVRIEMNSEVPVAHFPHRSDG